MRARFSAVLTIFDYAILAFMLFLVTLDVSEGFQNIGFDLLWINLIIFGLYLGVAFFANLPKIFVSNPGRWTKMILGFCAMLMIIFMYPALLRYLLLILDIKLSMPVDTMLLIVFALRMFIGIFLRRRWREA